MNQSGNKVKENSVRMEKGTSLAESAQKKQPETSQEKLRVSEVAGVGRNVVETIGLTEDVETSGRVSEVLSKTKEKSKGGAFAGTKGAQFDPTKIKEQLLRSVPNQKVMRKQIEREIKKEIKYLHKKAMRMIRSPHDMNFFEMSNIVRKIRELKFILVKVLKASVDSLKTLWLRYVHGVM